MTDRDVYAALAVLAGAVIFVFGVAVPIHRKHVRKCISQDDFPSRAVDRAFEARKREEREWEAEHG